MLTLTQVSAHTGILKELIRDVVHTTNPLYLLSILASLDEHIRSLQQHESLCKFTVRVGKYDLRVMCGSIHAWDHMSWDVYLSLSECANSQLENILPGEGLTTAEMVHLVKRVAAL